MLASIPSYSLTFHSPPSNTNVTHTFVVRPIESGVFHIPSARVLYEEAADKAPVSSIYISHPVLALPNSYHT